MIKKNSKTPRSRLGVNMKLRKNNNYISFCFWSVFIYFLERMFIYFEWMSNFKSSATNTTLSEQNQGGKL